MKIIPLMMMIIIIIIIIPYHPFHYRYDNLSYFLPHQVGRLSRPAIPEKIIWGYGGKYLQQIVYIYLQEIHNGKSSPRFLVPMVNLNKLPSAYD